MDLKRAWRNGFLALVVFAIPLSDLYNNQYSNLIADISATKVRVQHASKCGTDSSCAGLAEDANDDITGAATSWDNTIDENGLAIPGGAVTELLLGSGAADSSDNRKAATLFDPQDLLQPEEIGDVDLDDFGSGALNDDADFGALASLAYGFANPSAFAPGLSGPFVPGMFASAGKAASADIRSASGDDSETPSPGTGDESLHKVPEPSSFVLIMIGTISTASLLYRKSKNATRLS